MRFRQKTDSLEDCLQVNGKKRHVDHVMVSKARRLQTPLASLFLNSLSAWSCKHRDEVPKKSHFTHGHLPSKSQRQIIMIFAIRMEQRNVDLFSQTMIVPSDEVVRAYTLFLGDVAFVCKIELEVNSDIICSSCSGFF
jgi:hypothetical protein